MGQRTAPLGYFTEETMKHLRPGHGIGYKHRMRTLEAMLACQLTLTYGKYHVMMDLRQLAMSEEHMSYQQAEVMADILNQISIKETKPTDLLSSQDEDVDESIQIYKEYRHYLEMFKGGWFVPDVVEMFCERVSVGRVSVYYNIRPTCYLCKKKMEKSEIFFASSSTFCIFVFSHYI